MTRSHVSLATLALQSTSYRRHQSLLAGPALSPANSTDGARGPATPADPLSVRAPHLAQNVADPARLCVDPLFHGSEVSGG